MNDASAAKRELKESKRYNKTMEAIAIGKCLYLEPYRQGLGLHLKEEEEDEKVNKIKKLIVTLPQRPLTDVDLLKYMKSMKIPHLCGIFMRNEMPTSGPHKCESAVINLDNKEGPGTHWVAYKKIGNEVTYFR